MEGLPLSKGLKKFLLWNRGYRVRKYCENLSRSTRGAGLHLECL
jgi:hypothetical protein